MRREKEMAKGKSRKSGYRIPLIVFLIIIGLALSAVQTVLVGKFIHGYGSLMRSNYERDVSEAQTADNEDLSKWTVLVYMCGTDLETENGIASMAFDWMDDEEITDDVNVIVQTGGTLYWNNTDPYFSDDAVHDVDIPIDQLGRFKIEQGEVIELESTEIRSMGSAETLSDFISWGVSEYPAQRYMFVMWNHGYSEPYGNMERDEIFYENDSGDVINSLNSYVDESSYYNDCLTLDELSEGFLNGGAHFDLIAFNTCLSGSLEVASVVAPYGDYMVASEEVIPAVIGLPVEYITFLAQNPDCTADQAGSEILLLYESYINAYEEQYSSDRDIADQFAIGTMSMIDLSSMDEISSLMEEFWERLYYTTYDPSEFTSVINGASKCENYGAEGSIPGNLIDFRAFLSACSSVFTDTNVDEQLAELIDSSVVSVTGSARTNSHGMSIWFPSSLYPGALRSSYESMLNSYGIDYSESEIQEIIQRHMDRSFDGYIDNIEALDGYYWYAAFLQIRFSDFWSAGDLVWENINDHIDSYYSNRSQVNDNIDEIEYELSYDDYGNIFLDINSDDDSVLSVEANICLYLNGDGAERYYLLGSEYVHHNTDSSSSYDFNPNCEWLNINGLDVTVFRIEDTVDHSILAIPADINDVWSFIYIYNDKATGEYSPLYCAVIDPISGVATNEVFYLKEGDTIEFMYYALFDYDQFDPILAVSGLFDPFEYDGALDIERGEMFGNNNGDKTVLVNFLIRDSFGNITETSVVEIIYDENNEIVSVSEAQNYIDYTNLYEVTSVWG